MSDSITNRYFFKSPERRLVVEMNVPNEWKQDETTTQKLFAEIKTQVTCGFKYFVSNTDCYGFSTIAAAENCIRLKWWKV